MTHDTEAEMEETSTQHQQLENIESIWPRTGRYAWTSPDHTWGQSHLDFLRARPNFPTRAPAPSSFARRVASELRVANDQSAPCAASLVGDRLTFIRLSFEGPPNTPYEKGIFHLLLDLEYDDQQYPAKAPRTRLVTPIIHPNIDQDGRICLDILDNMWSPLITLRMLAISICSMLTSPDLEGPLVPEVANLYVDDPEGYDSIARAYTAMHATADQDLSEETLLKFRYARPGELDVPISENEENEQE